MDQENKLITARLHQSGCYFFCPHCSLSFPHPPHLALFYRIGYGWCWFCACYTPIEGGDKKGIVQMDETGKLYTEFYEEEDRERERQHARRIQELSHTKPARRRRKV